MLTADVARNLGVLAETVSIGLALIVDVTVSRVLAVR